MKYPCRKIQRSRINNLNELSKPPSIHTVRQKQKNGTFSNLNSLKVLNLKNYHAALEFKTNFAMLRGWDDIIPPSSIQFFPGFLNTHTRGFKTLITSRFTSDGGAPDSVQTFGGDCYGRGWFSPPGSRHVH